LSDNYAIHLPHQLLVINHQQLEQKTAVDTSFVMGRTFLAAGIGSTASKLIFDGFGIELCIHGHAA